MKFTSILRSGYPVAIIGAAAFSAFVLINRYAYDHAHVRNVPYISTFLFVAGMLAALDLLVTLRPNGIRALVITPERKLDTRMWKPLTNGVIATCSFVLIAYGQGHTSATNTSLITAANIIPTAIFAWLLLRTKLVAKQFATLAVVLIGLYIAIVGFDVLDLQRGDMFIMAGATIIGFTNSFARSMMDVFSARIVSDVRMVTGGVGALIVLVFMHGDNYFSASHIFYPVAAGACIFVSINCVMATVHRLGTNTAIVLAQLHIISTPIVAAFLLDEKYRATALIGSLIMIAGVILFTRAGSPASDLPKDMGTLE